MNSDPERDAFAAKLNTIQNVDTRASVDVTLTFESRPTLGADERLSETLPRLAIATPSHELSHADLRVIGTLGEGGMGVVRLAEQIALEREVAVKTSAGGDETASATLLREAKITGRLEHPNIVPIYTLGRDATGAPQIVMKRIEGTAWSEALGESAATADALDRHIDVLLRVCSAVRYAHSRGVIHRDIKPQNVMIGHFDEVYLLDWGLAVVLHDDERSDAADRLVGTPGFMAPEMTHGLADEIDERTDVYLLGATLHRILTGECRHDGDPLFEVLYAAYKSVPHDYGPDVPRELAEIANRACRREPDERFPSVDDFREALIDYRQHRESIELGNEADGRKTAFLATLERPASEANELAIHDLFGECRFGYLQALRMWPENTDARHGLQEVLEGMAAYHLTKKNVTSARACIRELPEPRPDLSAAADDLDAQRRAEAEDLDRLKRLEKSIDLETGMLTRSRLALVFGVIWTATTVRTAWHESSGDVSLDEQLTSHAVSGVRNVVIVVVLLALLGRPLLSNRANRRVVLTLVAMVSTVAIMRFGAWWLHADIATARMADDGVFGLTALMLGAVTDFRIALLSLLFYASLVTGIFWPEANVWATAVVNALFFGALAWIWSGGDDADAGNVWK